MTSAARVAVIWVALMWTKAASLTKMVLSTRSVAFSSFSMQPQRWSPDKAEKFSHCVLLSLLIPYVPPPRLAASFPSVC